MIDRERRGDYLGKTVQIVPHATDMVQQWLREVALVSVDSTGLESDVCLIEVRPIGYAVSSMRMRYCCP